MKSAFAWFVVIFFALHIPLTLVVDGQVLIPPTMVPESMQLAVLEFASNMKDDLMISPNQAPLWFKAVIGCEIFLQVPYFAFAAVAWIFEWESSIRSTMHVYTAHVLTTMVPIMLNILYGPSSGASSVAYTWEKQGWTAGPASALNRTPLESITLAAVYSPWLVIPVMISLVLLVTPRGKLFSGGKAKEA